MATLLLDTVQDAAMEFDYGILRRTRTGTVSGLAVAPGTSCSYTLETIYGILAAAGHVQGGNYLGDDGTVIAGLYLQNVQIKAISATDYRLLMTYTSERGQTPSTYIIEDGTAVTQVETSMIPGTRIPLRMGWQSASPDVSASIPADSLTFSIMMPIRTVRITALKYGEPVSDNQDLVGCVNNATWYGRDIGHWMVWDYDTSESKYSGYYTLQAEARAMAKWAGDWSQTQILKDSVTGKYVKVYDADWVPLRAAKYKYGIISIGQQDVSALGPDDVGYSGVMRVGFYPTIDFTSLFGFSTPPSRYIPPLSLTPHTP